MSLSYQERQLLEEHLTQLDQLARSHREYAATVSGIRECRLTKSDAVSAARRVESLAKVIRRLSKVPA